MTIMLSEGTVPQSDKAVADPKQPGGSTKTSSGDNVIVEKFVEVFNGTPVNFMVTKLSDSYVVWVALASPQPVLGHVVIGMMNRFENGPLASPVCHYFGSTQDSMNMALRMTKKTKKVVYLTCQVPSELMLPVEKCLVDRLAQ